LGESGSSCVKHLILRRAPLEFGCLVSSPSLTPFKIQLLSRIELAPPSTFPFQVAFSFSQRPPFFFLVFFFLPPNVSSSSIGNELSSIYMSYHLCFLQLDWTRLPRQSSHTTQRLTALNISSPTPPHLRPHFPLSLALFAGKD